MTNPPHQLTVFEFRSYMGSGQTRPLRCRASLADGTEVPIVLKLRDPGSTGAHFGGTSLACELIMAVAARAIGLNVPDFGIAHVGSIFAGGVSDPQAHAQLSANQGPNFASFLVTPAISTWDPMCRLQSSPLRRAIEGVLTFDSAVVNGDRTEKNPNLLWDGAEEVFLIDHGLSCPIHTWTPAQIAASPLPPDSFLQSHSGYQYLHKNAVSFNWLLDAWANSLDGSFWASVRAMIPSEWERTPGDIDRVISFLSDRPRRFPDLAAELRRVIR